MSDSPVLAIENEEIIEYHDNSITVLHSNGKKAIMYPDDINYRIEIVSRDTGTMNYQIVEVEGITPVRYVETYDIPLYQGQLYTGQLPCEFGVANAEYALTTDNIEVPCNYDSIDSQECDRNGHSYGKWIVESEPSEDTAGLKMHICSVCGKVERISIIHVHTCIAGSEWFYNENYHWNGCTGYEDCQKHLNESAHIFGNDNVCDICGYIKPTEKPDIPSNPSTDDSSDSDDRATIFYTIAVPKTENGNVTVTPKNASKGTVVTLTLKADEGYELDKLIVTDRNGKELALTDKGDNRFTFVMPSGTVIVNASFRPAEITWSNPFADVSGDSWYYDAVAFAMEKGIMSGYSADTFAPNDNLSRAMLAQILYNLEEKPSARTDIRFTDVSGDAWYSDAVLWAAENGIAQGYDGHFDPEAPITREQVATMLWNYAGKPATDNARALNYSDADKISGWAVNAMLWATENNVMSGYDGMLDPAGQATRAQIAQMMKNYLDN